MFSLFRKSATEKLGEQVAKDYLNSGREQAANAVDRAKQRLLTDAVFDEELTDYLADGGGMANLQAVESQFLWGFFHEHVQTLKLQTNGFQRILVHMIDFLYHERGYSLEDARAEAWAVDELYNRADGLFEAIANLGKQAFHDVDADDAFVRVMRALKDQHAA